MKRLLVINGPNLNMLGIRDPEVYGKQTYRDLLKLIRTHAKERGCVIKCFQSNYEGAIIDEIQSAYGMYDGIIINAGGYTHTSVAIRDAISSVSPIPVIEVHISDISKREEFRHFSFLTDVCAKTIMGKGFQGYLEAIDFLSEKY